MASSHSVQIFNSNKLFLNLHFGVIGLIINNIDRNQYVKHQSNYTNHKNKSTIRRIIFVGILPIFKIWRKITEKDSKGYQLNPNTGP